MDLDKNSYPDIAVGSLSDSVSVFRYYIQNFNCLHQGAGCSSLKTNCLEVTTSCLAWAVSFSFEKLEMLGGKEIYIN